MRAAEVEALSHRVTGAAPRGRFATAMAILDDLQQRGLIQEVTHRDELAKLLGSQVVPLYAGYDPTSPSLHVGNLVPTILLKRFQLAGHRPIVLVGGALSFVYMLRIYQRVFWSDASAESTAAVSQPLARTLVLTLAIFLLAIGFWPEPLLAVSRDAAAVLAGGSS